MELTFLSEFLNTLDEKFLFLFGPRMFDLFSTFAHGLNIVFFALLLCCLLPEKVTGKGDLRYKLGSLLPDAALSSVQGHFGE